MVICKPRHWNWNWNWSWHYKRHYISTYVKPMDPKLGRVMTQDEETIPTKSRDALITWSLDK